MKILHVILGKADKNRANGVNQVIAGLASHTVSNGFLVSVIGFANSAAFEGEVIEREGFEVTVYTKKANVFSEALSRAVDQADIVHLHSTYSPLNIKVGLLCDRLSTPYVVTLHGGLSPARNTWRNRPQKYLFHLLFQKRHLERAALIHAITEEESTDALAKFVPRSITVIPNGVDLKDFPSINTRDRLGPILRIGYIGRLSQEKNLDALCEAFSVVNSNNEMQLILAGPVSAYGEEIIRRWSSHGIVLVGPKFGIEKLEFLDSIDLFVQPSKTDVFSISAMEALARGVPMVLTRTSDASHFAETGAFIMCEPTSFGIERGLRKALDKQVALSAMVSRGRHLIEERLNWSVVTRELIGCYGKVLREQ